VLPSSKCSSSAWANGQPLFFASMSTTSATSPVTMGDCSFETATRNLFYSSATFCSQQENSCACAGSYSPSYFGGAIYTSDLTYDLVASDQMNGGNAFAYFCSATDTATWSGAVVSSPLSINGRCWNHPAQAAQYDDIFCVRGLVLPDLSNTVCGGAGRQYTAAYYYCPPPPPPPTPPPPSPSPPPPTSQSAARAAIAPSAAPGCRRVHTYWHHCVLRPEHVCPVAVLHQHCGKILHQRQLPNEPGFLCLVGVFLHGARLRRLDVCVHGKLEQWAGCVLPKHEDWQWSLACGNDRLRV
jgi:hypothetical protein